MGELKDVFDSFNKLILGLEKEDSEFVIGDTTYTLFCTKDEPSFKSVDILDFIELSKKNETLKEAYDKFLNTDRVMTSKVHVAQGIEDNFMFISEFTSHEHQDYIILIINKH